MHDKPLGIDQHYCSQCGSEVVSRIPAGDNKLRYVCDQCGAVHYENPKLVVGCVTQHAGKILLCKRSIEPRYGYWTVPAGFMELGETLEQAACRETLEEACAKVALGGMLAVVDVPEAGQVHVFFRGVLVGDHYAAGDESLDARLYAPEEIPWDEIAFSSGRIALEQFIAQRQSGTERLHTEVALRNRPAG